MIGHLLDDFEIAAVAQVFDDFSVKKSSILARNRRTATCTTLISLSKFMSHT